MCSWPNTPYHFLSSEMPVGGDSLNGDERTDTGFVVTRANLLIRSSCLELASITLVVSGLTTRASGSRNSPISNTASVTLTRYRGNDEISSTVWRRRILKWTDLNFAGTALSTMLCFIVSMRPSPHGFPSLGPGSSWRPVNPQWGKRYPLCRTVY